MTQISSEVGLVIWTLPTGRINGLKPRLLVYVLLLSSLVIQFVGEPFISTGILEDQKSCSSINSAKD